MGTLSTSRHHGEGNLLPAKVILNRPDRITIVTLWVVFGQRNRCQFCAGPIGHLDLDLEVDADLPTGQKVLHFHGLCHNRWVTEAASATA